MRRLLKQRSQKKKHFLRICRYKGESSENIIKIYFVNVIYSVEFRTSISFSSWHYNYYFKIPITFMSKILKRYISLSNKFLNNLKYPSEHSQFHANNFGRTLSCYVWLFIHNNFRCKYIWSIHFKYFLERILFRELIFL